MGGWGDRRRGGGGREGGGGGGRERIHEYVQCMEGLGCTGSHDIYRSVMKCVQSLLTATVMSVLLSRTRPRVTVRTGNFSACLRALFAKTICYMDRIRGSGINYTIEV